MVTPQPKDSAVRLDPRTEATPAVPPRSGSTTADDGGAVAAAVPAPGWVGEVTMTWPRALAYGLAAFVVSRLCVLLGAGVRASQLVVDANNDNVPAPGSPVGMVTGVFTSWDGLWYLEIVRNGYPRSIPPNITYGQSEARAAFFPVFPTIVRFADAVLPGGDSFAALSVNLVLSVIAVVLVGVMARRLAGAEVAARSMVLFSVFPGSFVLSYAYSEAALIVLAAACLLFLMDERWWLAGIAAALATATRPNGMALVAACAVASFIAIRRRRDWWSLVAVLLSPLGFISFQIFLAAHTDETGAWFRVQREAWEEGTSFGATAVRNTLSFLTHPFDSPTDAVTAVSLVAMVGALWCLYRRRLPPPIVAYVVVVLLLMLLPATVTARPRFLFTAFPLVIPVAWWWPERDRFGWELLLVVCGAGLTALTMLYGVFGAIP
jgi:Glycosyltransferase family 87